MPCSVTLEVDGNGIVSGGGSDGAEERQQYVAAEEGQLESAASLRSGRDGRKSRENRTRNKTVLEFVPVGMAMGIA